MRRRAPVLLLHAVLLFQLAVGMYWPGAAAAAMPLPPSGSRPEHCLGHSSAAATGTAHALRSAPATARHAGDHSSKHDCCRTAGCQCHGTAMSAEPSVRHGIALPAWVLPPVEAPVADWRSDASLRPPIL